MKKLLLLMLLCSGNVLVFAQSKNNLFVDLGVSYGGVSATFDRKVHRHLDVGAGFSTYNFNDANYANVRSAVYLDIRPYWVKRRGLWFVFADIGGAFIGGRKPASAENVASSLYTCLGGGYSYRINKRGMGPYVSLGLYGYTLGVKYNAPQPAGVSDYSVYEANSLFSLGFKF